MKPDITPPIDTVPTSTALDGAPKKRNYFFWILAILALAAIFVTSFLILIGKSKPTPTDSLIQPTPSFSETSVKESDPTANWETYASKVNRYSFKYPSTWTIIENNFSTLLFLQETQVLSIKIPDDYDRSLERGNLFEKIAAEIEVGVNNKALSKEWKQLINYYDYELLFEDKRVVISSQGRTPYVLEFSNSLARNTQDQILSTFKFIDSQGVTSETSAALSDPKLVEFVRGYLKMTAETRFEIEKVEGDYAYGAGGTENASGFYWAAARKDGQWNYAFGGNGIPDCSEVEIFPSTVFDGKFNTCYSGNNLILRSTGEKL